MGLPVGRVKILIYTFSGFCSALGGVGYVVGTVVGVLILGVIQTLIMFDGSLSSWWTKIAIGALLFVFCLMQRLFEARSGKSRGAVHVSRPRSALDEAAAGGAPGAR